MNACIQEYHHRPASHQVKKNPTKQDIFHDSIKNVFLNNIQKTPLTIYGSTINSIKTIYTSHNHVRQEEGECGVRICQKWEMYQKSYSTSKQKP